MKGRLYPLINTERYRKIVEAQTELICRFLPDGTLTFVNQAYCRYFGKSQAELIGTSFMTLIPEYERHAVQKKIASLNRDNPVITYEHQVINGNGEIRWQQWSDRVILNNTGTPIEYQSVGRDITKLKHIEAQLRRVQNKLEQRVKERTAELARVNQDLLKEISERKHAEEVLRQNEAQLLLITNNMLDMICQVDINGIIEYVSPSNKTILGYELDDLLNKPVFSFIHPDDTGTVMNTLHKMVNKKAPGRLELRYRHADGHYLWVESMGNCLLNENGEISGAVFGSRDINQRKKAERKLKKSEQHLKDIINFLPDATFAIDALGKIIAWNRAAEEITGIKFEDIRGKDQYEHAIAFYGTRKPMLIDLMLKPDPEQEQSYSFITREGDSLIGENYCPVIGKKGALLWGKASRLYDNSGNLVGAIESIRDITERKQALEALRQSEEKYRSLFNTMVQGVMCFDLEGKIISANPAAGHLFGLTPEKMLGKTIKELGGKIIYEDGSDFPLHNLPSAVAIRTGERINNVVIGLVNIKEAETRWVMVNAVPDFIKEESRPFQVYITITDITDIKKTEKALELSLNNSQKTLEGTVHALARTSEKRDPYTAGHQRRVAQLARAIGQEMGLSDKQLQTLHIASILHDIGKMYVPAEILSKPGQLSYGEMLLIKSHPEVGSDIVSTIPFDRSIPLIILQHHERMDGSGYPFCLAGEDILLESRILAVADVVEAMASHRPYRPAHTLEKALGEITQNKGILYDAEVVDTCLNLFRNHKFSFD